MTSFYFAKSHLLVVSISPLISIVLLHSMIKKCFNLEKMISLLCFDKNLKNDTPSSINFLNRKVEYCVT